VAELKFGQLPPGRRFRWKDAEWLKTSPILASPADGGKPVLVPRSARVEALDGLPPQTPAAPLENRIDPVLKELQRNLLGQLETLPLSPDQRKALEQQLGLLIEQARNQLQNPLQE